MARLPTVSALRAALARDEWRFPLGLFALTRAAYLAGSYVGLRLVPLLYYHEDTRHQFLRAYPALDGFCRWDCGWFEKVVREGFGPVVNAQVFPLLPALAWLGERAGINRFIGLILIPNLASLGSFLVLYRIFRDLEGPHAARKALLLYAVFPFAFFQAAGYSDALMVLGSALAIRLALRGRHLAAGVVLGIGVLARHITLCAGAGLLAAQIRQRPGFRRFLGSPALAGLVIPWLFLAGWALLVGHLSGDPRALLTARDKQWGEMAYWGVIQAFTKTSYARDPEYFIYMAFALVPIAGAALLCTRRRWAELAAAGVVLVLVCLGSGVVGLGRYLGTCWPAFLPLGVILARRPGLADAVLLALALMQGVFFFLYTHQYRIL